MRVAADGTLSKVADILKDEFSVAPGFAAGAERHSPDLRRGSATADRSYDSSTRDVAGSDPHGSAAVEAVTAAVPRMAAAPPAAAFAMRHRRAGQRVRAQELLTIARADVGWKDLHARRTSPTAPAYPLGLIRRRPPRPRRGRRLDEARRPADARASRRRPRDGAGAKKRACRVNRAPARSSPAQKVGNRNPHKENDDAIHGDCEGDKSPSGRAPTSSCSPRWASSTRSWSRPASCWRAKGCTRAPRARASSSGRQADRRRRPVRRDQGAGRRLLAAADARRWRSPSSGSSARRSSPATRDRDPAGVRGRGLRRQRSDRELREQEERLRETVAASTRSPFGDPRRRLPAGPAGRGTGAVSFRLLAGSVLPGASRGAPVGPDDVDADRESASFLCWKDFRISNCSPPRTSSAAKVNTSPRHPGDVPMKRPPRRRTPRTCKASRRVVAPVAAQQPAPRELRATERHPLPRREELAQLRSEDHRSLRLCARGRVAVASGRPVHDRCDEIIERLPVRAVASAGAALIVSLSSGLLLLPTAEDSASHFAVGRSGRQPSIRSRGRASPWVGKADRAMSARRVPGARSLAAASRASRIGSMTRTIPSCLSVGRRVEQLTSSRHVDRNRRPRRAPDCQLCHVDQTHRHRGRRGNRRRPLNADGTLATTTPGRSADGSRRTSAGLGRRAFRAEA